MKKPGRSKSANAQRAMQKAQSRNFQKNPTKRTGVHLPRAIAKLLSEPLPKVRETRNSRMIDLKVAAMTRRLVASMRDCAGASFETHSEACGLELSSFYEWMAKGEELPQSCYGKFRAATIEAMAEGEKRLHKAAMRTHAIHLLARRFPNHYPSERQLMEISAKDRMPFSPTEQQFSVVLELH